MAFIVMITKSSYGLHHLLPTLRSLRTTRAVLTDREAFCFLSVVFLCFGVLCVLPISLFHLVSVCFFSPGLISGMRRRRRRKKSRSRSPIQRRRERTMPNVRARTGTEGWTHLIPKVRGSFLLDLCCRCFTISCPLGAHKGKRSHPCAQAIE